MYLHKLNLTNFGCFHDAELNFDYPGRIENVSPTVSFPTNRCNGSTGNVNLILGACGLGKSTILKAAALALIAPILKDSGFRPSSLVRSSFGIESLPDRCEISAKVLLNEQDYLPHFASKLGSRLPRRGLDTLRHLEASFLRSGTSNVIHSIPRYSGIWENMFYRESPAFFVVGYGVTSSVVDRSFRKHNGDSLLLLRYKRIQGLFEQNHSLVPLEDWLPELHKIDEARSNQVVSIIAHAIRDDCRFTGRYEGGKYWIKNEELDLPLGSVSDGIRCYFEWLSDLLFHLCMGTPSGLRLDQAQGIVIVDEIGLHLDPEWQCKIVTALSEALPKLQFIVTNRSPIVLGALRSCNIHVLCRERTKRRVASVSKPGVGNALIYPRFSPNTISGRRNTELPQAELALIKLRPQSVS